MALALYDGRTTSVNVAGFTTVVVMPAVAGFDTPAVTAVEIDAGTRIDCDIRKVGVSADVKNSQDQFLCDESKTEFAGAIEYSMDDLVLQAGDPQNPDPFLKTLTRGTVVYIGIRRGLKSAEPFAAAQVMNELIKAEITYNGWAEAEASDDGKKHERLIKLAVKDAEMDVVIS